MNSVMPLTRACAYPLRYGLCAPGEVLGRTVLACRAAILLGDCKQAIGGVGALVEDHVFAGFAQRRLDRLVDCKLAGVDDAHVHAGLDCVVEEDGVHGFTHRLVAAEREAQIGDATRNVRVGEGGADLTRRLDEGDAVSGVLFDAGGDGKDVGVEHDVLGREADLLGQ